MTITDLINECRDCIKTIDSGVLKGMESQRAYYESLIESLELLKALDSCILTTRDIVYPFIALIDEHTCNKIKEWRSKYIDIRHDPLWEVGDSVIYKRRRYKIKRITWSDYRQDYLYIVMPTLYFCYENGQKIFYHIDMKRSDDHENS